MQTACKSQCKGKKSEAKAAGGLSFLSGLFITLIPKCPFCILSFTSAITVCSSKEISGYAPHWTSYISIVFAVLTLLIVTYNYKGTRTQVALLFILIGSLLIIYSEMYTGLIQTYYWGSGVLLFGVWVNGNLLYFVQKFFKFFRIAESHA